MGKRKPKTTGGRGSKSRTKRTDGDWMDYMNGQLWEWLDRVPLIITILEKCGENGAAKALEQISHHLDDLPSPDFIKNVLEWSTNRLIEGQTTRFDNIANELGSIQYSLQNFSNVGIAGQISGIFVSAAANRQIRRLADQAEQMATHLAGIEQCMNAIHMQGDKFAQHVHSYVRMMIEDHSEDDVPHFFAVFNRQTDWQPTFRDLERANPLGPEYLGYKHDLDELCECLVTKVRPRIGPEAVLHILTPSSKRLVIAEAVKFPEQMRPFFIDGELGDGGLPYVWLCTPNLHDKQQLRNVGVLKPRGIYSLPLRLPIPFPLFPISGLLCSDQGIITEKLVIDPFFQFPDELSSPMAHGAAKAMSMIIFSYIYKGLEPARTLGRKTLRPWYVS